MVTIRLARSGAKKRPFYHLVATDSRRARDGRYLEQLGYFNPVAKGQEPRLHILKERVDYWLSVGAQTSLRIKALLKEFAKGATAATAKPKQEKKVKKAEKTAESLKTDDTAPNATD